MLMEAHCITIQVIRAILFEDSLCCGGAHRQRQRVDARQNRDVSERVLLLFVPLHQRPDHVARADLFGTKEM